MDPIEILEICKTAAERGAPKDIPVPRVFNAGYYQELWAREPKKVRAILDYILCAERPREGLEMLLKFNILDALFPEISAMLNMGDHGGLHKNVWDHTINVVSGVPNTLELRWGALLHDVGKVRTRRVINGRVTFHNHDRVGAKIVNSINDRMGLFNDDVQLLRTVRQLVLYHLRPAGYKKSWTDSAVRRFITECGDDKFFQKLLTLSRADLTTKIPEKRIKAMKRADELEARVKDVLSQMNAPKLPKGTMGFIIEKSNQKPGHWLNDLRAELESMMANGQLMLDQQVSYYVDAGLKLLEHGNN